MNKPGSLVPVTPVGELVAAPSPGVLALLLVEGPGAAAALEAVGQTVKYGYWDFGTDASKTCGIDRKPTIGYSPMQEQYAHTPYDKCRTDFMKTALVGNAAIYLNTSAQGPEAFAKVEW